ncbi:MAG TPA: chromosomal replication initiator protein DnaA [Candidatus Limnocylindrales bacterium]|nr:chromosomal replication initiator protein DnaA [Candidatus Limnocylindrales bacterium]
MDAKQVWRAALGELQVSLSPANFETWLRDTALVEVDDSRFRIAVPNGFAKDWLESRYRSLISQTLARVVGYSVQVEFLVGPTPEAPARDETDGRDDGLGLEAAAATRAPVAAASNGHAMSSMPARSGPPASQQVRVEPTRVGGEGGASNLNPRYTFANFIVGSANRLAHAASLSVAERPGHAYNPLFLYGGVGLGKTHLMHAIGNQVIAKFPRKRVVYATSEKFTNEFITSIQQGKIDEFRSRYRRIDVLLIDDIQFIADKERTQEEFFHTFNAIHEDGKQIVLSSDRPPKAILTLEERLRSRFEWGLIADLTAPDLETRIAILRAKAEEGAVPITSDVIEFIARKVVSNIRELEGALNRIVAYASMGAMPISIELAQAVLSNVLYNPKKRQITPERIAKAVSEYYGVGLDALRGQKRDKAIVVPRQIAMFLMREETDVSLLRIGAELGGRDHSTVLHACDKITRESAGNDELRREIAAVRELIYAD